MGANRSKCLPWSVVFNVKLHGITVAETACLQKKQNIMAFDTTHVVTSRFLGTHSLRKLSQIRLVQIAKSLGSHPKKFYYCIRSFWRSCPNSCALPTKSTQSLEIIIFLHSAACYDAKWRNNMGISKLCMHYSSHMSLLYWWVRIGVI